MRVHVIIRGHVQGVGFRWFVREAARAKQLAGWVANRSDGGVEVAAEGPATEINWLLEQLREGPPGASVTDLENLPPDGSVLPGSFAIRR